MSTNEDEPTYTREEFATAAGNAHRHLHEWVIADTANDAAAARAAVIAAHTALHHVGVASRAQMPSPLPALLASARDVATGKIAHTFAGWCPGPSDSDKGMDRRDPNCAACKVALALDDGRVLAASGRTDERAAFLRESLAATVADCARLRSDLAAETETRQALRAQEDTIYGMLADAADVPTDPIAGVAMLVKQRASLRVDAAHLRDREATIIRALAPVSDGGQYRADIVSAIGRIVEERSEARAQRDAALAEIDTLRLLVVAAGVAMRERAAEVAEDCDHDNCAAAIRALDPVPAKP